MKTVVELTAKAAETYLQSAVFIDDEIFSRASGRPLGEQEMPLLRSRKPAFAAAGIEAGEATKIVDPCEGAKSIVVTKTPAGNEGAKVIGGTKAGAEGEAPLKRADAAGQPEFHPKEIVGSFAQRGIVCALYEPALEFKTDEDSEVFKLCQAADLVILDWDFQKDDGAKMRELVVALVTQGNRTIPHHSRLVVIYTTTPSLVKVASAIFDCIKQAGMQPEPAGSSLRLDVGATRIVVPGKLSVERHGEEASFSVGEKDLADRVFDEFVSKNAGILSSCALLAMAAVKRNSRRVLAKFGSDMDGAFLLHRALLLHNEEAFDTLPALIAEEFLAVVEDHFAKIGDWSEVVRERVAGMPVACPAGRWSAETGEVNEKGNRVFRQVSNDEFAMIARALLNEGVKGLKSYRDCTEVKKLSGDAKSFTRGQDPSVIGALRGAVDARGIRANERLAALFNARTYYDQQARVLTLGTVVRFGEREKSEYSLCLVPVCDAVRLRCDRSYEFPFLRLSCGISGQCGGNGCVVEDIRDQLVELVASPRIRGLSIEKFTPKGGAGVIAAERDGEGFWLTADGSRRYEWVGQLKPAHAQRVAHSVGQALSRVGLSEAEWVRILCDRE